MSEARRHPLAEVFGYPTDNLAKQAHNHRLGKLCPYNNKVRLCTKDKKDDPLGVCSVFDSGAPVITCPIRFRENWDILSDAAAFLFGQDATWTSFEEVRVFDAQGKVAGNFDFVLVSYSQDGKILDFGALEVQAVYISGNVRKPFQHYIADPARRWDMTWSETQVRPDYLSSSRKRLVPQLMYKGGILQEWGKRMAVALQEPFFRSLPELPSSDERTADILWLVYDLVDNERESQYNLRIEQKIYTEFEAVVEAITVPASGRVEEFRDLLQDRFDRKRSGVATDLPPILR